MRADILTAKRRSNFYEMTGSRYIKIVLILGFAGFLFSGYLSAVKLITSSCALSEPCPYFLGYPACWFGFIMFTVLFVSSLVGFYVTAWLKKVALIQAAVSFAGILFAGYFTLPEVGRLFSGDFAYSLGLPTCAYGLIFYIAIFMFSVLYLKIGRVKIQV